MQSVEFSLGPLLIEIERPMNEKLGIILSNYSSLQNKINDICPAGIYISSILPASIADRLVFFSLENTSWLRYTNFFIYVDAVHYQSVIRY